MNYSNIYDVGNPLLFWIGLLSVAILTVLFLLRKKKIFSWQIGFLLLVYCIVWAPWTFSPRIMFFYHYAPAVPTMVVLTSFGILSLWNKYRELRLLLVLLVLCVAATCLILYPLNTGLPMHQSYFDAIFALFPSWK